MARSESVRPRVTLRRWAPALVVALAATAPTLGRFANGFVTDDRAMIVDGDVIHHLGNLPGVLVRHAMAVTSTAASERQRTAPIDTYRPVTIATFFANAQLSGRRPWAYHLTNLALHLACALLLFRVLRLAMCDAPDAPDTRWVQCAAACWFAVSPELCEAHVWINGRSDVCCALFLLLALRARASAARQVTAANAAVIGACFLGALLSKEAALVPMPLLCWMPVGRPPTQPGPTEPLSWRALVRLGAPPGVLRVVVACLAAVAVYAALRSHAVSAMGVRLSSARWKGALSAAPWLTVEAMRALLVPEEFRLRWLSDDLVAAGGARIAFAWLLCTAGVAGVVAALRRVPMAAWGVAFFATALAPAFVLTALRGFGFGRFLYVPALGLAVAFAVLLQRARARVQASGGPLLRRAGPWLVGAYLALLGGRLALTVPAWRDEPSLAVQTVRAEPARPGGYALLALNARNAGHGEDARQLYLDADRRAPYNPGYLLNAGELALEQGDLRAALGVAATGIGRYRERSARFHQLAARALHGERPGPAAAHLRECQRLLAGRGVCDLARDPGLSPLP